MPIYDATFTMKNALILSGTVGNAIRRLSGVKPKNGYDNLEKPLF